MHIPTHGNAKLYSLPVQRAAELSGDRNPQAQSHSRSQHILLWRQRKGFPHFAWNKQKGKGMSGVQDAKDISTIEFWGPGKAADQLVP